MKTGKITAKLRDAVKIHLVEEGHPDSGRTYKNIELPDMLKDLEYKDFEFLIMGEKIEFEITYEPGTLPQIMPAERPPITRAEKRIMKAREEKERQRIEAQRAKDAANAPATTTPAKADDKPAAAPAIADKPAPAPVKAEVTAPVAPAKTERKPATAPASAQAKKEPAPKIEDKKAAPAPAEMRPAPMSSGKR